MFRTSCVQVGHICRKSAVLRNNKIITIGSSRFMSAHSTETDEEFDARYEAYFNRQNIDGWEIRKAMNDLVGLDNVPEPKIVIAALKATRRVNDISLAIRFLEAVKIKCGNRKDIYPYIIQEIRPTLQELGISTPEELGYDKPELALEKVYEVHG